LWSGWSMALHAGSNNGDRKSPTVDSMAAS
jgi:hypothetical protein